MKKELENYKVEALAEKEMESTNGGKQDNSVGGPYPAKSSGCQCYSCTGIKPTYYFLGIKISL